MDLDSFSFDWFILLLRIAFIGIIFWFLYRISRVSIRELMAVGKAAPSTAGPDLHRASSALEMVDPVESTIEAGTLLPLDHYTTIGRGSDNLLVIDDGFVSTSHAELAFDAGDWWLMDLRSTNGTFVNDAPIRNRTLVQDGDIVQFGRVRLRVHT